MSLQIDHLTTAQKQTQETLASYSPWSSQIEPGLAEFCRVQVYEPWKKILQANRGEITKGTLPPLLGLGPSVPVSLLPVLFHPALVRAFLGQDPNMVTIVLNRAHNRIVFFAAERTEGGRYVEMVRLDEALPAQVSQEVCHMLQAGEDEKAFAHIHTALEERGLQRFKPGLLKIADLYFFEHFQHLSQMEQPSLAYLQGCLRVAHDVIARRLLYFYPRVPFEKMLSGLRAVLPRMAYSEFQSMPT